MKTNQTNEMPRRMTYYRWQARLLVAAIAATVLCNPGPTNAAADTTSVRRGAENEKRVPLNFTLADAYGREVRADDYRGLPLLIIVGACWCGGCQGDATVLRTVEQKYRGRGLQTIRSTSLDNELPIWEFVKHYRLPSVPLVDPVREFEKQYNRSGWTFLMLVDAAGRVVYRANSPIDWARVEPRIVALLPKENPAKPIERDGVTYLPGVLTRSDEIQRGRSRDCFPSMACAADGRKYVVFTTNRNGTQDVYLRVFDGKQWLPDRPVAATQADEFDGTVIVDGKNRAWISWTSNARGPRYDIFVAPVSADSSVGEPMQVTQSDDDAMHARMAVDSRGRLWVTYYHWQEFEGRSRDKEIYARYLEGSQWSKAMRISPEDVPDYEDHTDPVVAALGDAMVFAWSWDFHWPKGYSRVPDKPSIFLRKINFQGVLDRARAVSGPNCDSRPAIAVAPDGRIWCAWESASPAGGVKNVSFGAEDLAVAEDPGLGTNVSGPQKNICTPCLAISPQGTAAMVWAAVDAAGRWTLKQVTRSVKDPSWTSPRTIVDKGNPRFPSIAYTKDGKLNVAYTMDKENRREIEVYTEP